MLHTLVLLIVLVVIVGFCFGMYWLIRRLLGVTRFMNQVVTEETARPGDPNAPRGVGGLTAAQTTAMAERMLGGINFHQNSVMPLPTVLEKPPANTRNSR